MLDYRKIETKYGDKYKAEWDAFLEERGTDSVALYQDFLADRGGLDWEDEFWSPEDHKAWDAYIAEFEQEWASREQDWLADRGITLD